MTGEFKVFHIPDFTGGNPYQELLVENLRAHGVNAEVADLQVGLPFPLTLGILARRGKPEVLHLHWLHPFLLADRKWETFLKSSIFIFELLVLKLLGVRFVWTAHNFKNHEERHLKLERFFTSIVARISDQIIVHCPTAREKLKEEFPVNGESKITVIPHGNYIDYYERGDGGSKARKKLSVGEDKLNFLYFGLIRPYKGVIKLIQNFKSLSYRDANLIVAGKPHSKEMEQRVENELDDNRIRPYLKFIPEKSVGKYMETADVVVFAYRDILTSGGVILAMSFGKPVIAPDMNCISDVLDDKGSFLYDPENDNGLLQMMKKAAQSKKQLEAMGKHNLERAKQWDWYDIAEMTCEVYGSV